MHKSLTGFAWLSIGAALLTICLKTIAYSLTGSVGLLSDALESLINLAAAIMALWMLKIAETPPDEDHTYGHTKAEYFSSIIEGILIVIAAISIGFTAVDRFIHPRILEQISLGLAVSIIASVINLIVAIILLKQGKKNHSITLQADGHHLLTDVWTSVGVIVGIGAVALTGWYFLDPLVAIGVAINIIFTGTHLMKESVGGFMDSAIPQEERKQVRDILEKYCKDGILYHGLRTRQSASRRFVSFHLLVPEQWTIQQGHDFSEKIEKEIRDTIHKCTVTTHIEPANDPKSWEDITIDRK